MRFKQYIDESMEIKEVGNLIKPKIKPLYDFLKKHNWIVSDKQLIDQLNKIFKSNDIDYMFKLTTDKGKIYRNIAGGGLSILKGNVGLEIELVKGVSDFFKRFAKGNKDKIFLDIRKNQFFSDLLSMMSHEFRHIGQLVSSKFKTKLINPEDATVGEYFGSDAEIDAFAFQAAIEFLKYDKHGGVYKTYSKIFDINDKPYKKFLKRLESYKSKLKKMKLDKIF